MYVVVGASVASMCAVTKCECMSEHLVLLTFFYQIQLKCTNCISDIVTHVFECVLFLSNGPDLSLGNLIVDPVGHLMSVILLHFLELLQAIELYLTYSLPLSVPLIPD